MAIEPTVVGETNQAEPMKIVVHGTPTPDEVAAIVAAIEMSWPQPAPVPTRRAPESTNWRYSGRWWQDGRLPPRWG